MGYHVGDPIVHWAYGLGKIIALEEHVIAKARHLYYQVKLKNMTVWVPLDRQVTERLRPPSTARTFKKLFSILSQPGEPLPDDAGQRKQHLLDQLKDGQARSFCRVISSLYLHQHVKGLNESDQVILKRVRTALLGEWTFAMNVSPAQAELELQRRLERGLAKARPKE